MPTVSTQNLIAVLPELVRIIRGQSNSAKITLHQDVIGNQLNIGIIDDVKVELYNTNNVLVSSFSKSQATLSYGTPNTDNRGDVVISITADQSASLPFADTNVSGSLTAKIYVTTGVNTVQLPTLKVGNIYDAGTEVDGIVASRFTLPGAVYKVKSFAIADKPAQGELILNDTDPAGVTKIRVAVCDDKGYRNSFLEGCSFSPL
jgi:hypothetical protein